MNDPINPAHYQGFSNGAQVIDITEHLSFNAGNAVKYLARAGRKDPTKHLEDLEKSAWYVAREIGRITGEAEPEPPTTPTVTTDMVQLMLDTYSEHVIVPYTTRAQALEKAAEALQDALGGAHA